MKLLLAIVALCVFSQCINAQGAATETAPKLVLKDLKRRTVNLNDFKGKVVVINFWATWCPPCRAEIPQLVKWQNEYGDRGLQIIGITVPPTKSQNVVSFARKNKINYPVLFGSKKTKIQFTDAQTMPFTVVIDADGNIRSRIEGIIFADEFDREVVPLIKPARPM